MMRAGRSVCGFLVAVLMAFPALAADGGGRGILLLAHGSHAPAPAGHGHGHGHGGGPADVWNSNVERLAAELDAEHPTEVAFGMADPRSIQEAVDRLSRRGVTDIAAVPLFVSSHSPIIGNFRYILGLQDHLARTTSLTSLERVRSDARFRFGGAMDDHPLVGAILLERAAAVGGDPAATTLILIAHGPNTEEENREWLADLETHAAFLRERGGFRAVRALTHRNDAPPAVKDAARAAFRAEVEQASRTGAVTVVPVLLSAGGIERQVEADLAGLTYRFAAPLMPHANLRKWVLARYDALFAEGAEPSNSR